MVELRILSRFLHIMKLRKDILPTDNNSKREIKAVKDITDTVN